jgi:hypothetical protein
MLDRSRQPGEGVSDNLKLKFLALMCQLRPDRVVTALKTFIFPLEESLAICEKYKNLHGQAHIKSRTRAIDSAIKIYMEVSHSYSRSCTSLSRTTWSMWRARTKMRMLPKVKALDIETQRRKKAPRRPRTTWRTVCLLTR